MLIVVCIYVLLLKGNVLSVWYFVGIIIFCDLVVCIVLCIVYIEKIGI